VRRAARACRLAEPLDPLAAIAALRRRGPVVALETTRPSADHGRQTLVAGAPLATFAWGRGRELCGREERAAAAAGGTTTLFHALERRIAADAMASDAADAPPLGAFGYFGYECVAPPELPRLDPFPDAWFLLAGVVIHWEAPGAAPTLWSAPERAELVPALRAELEADRSGVARAPAEPPSAAPDAAFDAPGDFTREEHAAACASARASLARGDSYQLCFTYPIVRRFAGDPLQVHAALRRENPAPFAAFLAGPFGAVVSSSPERFLRVDRSGCVEARPMKGTAARPVDERARGLAARELAGSEKARAENLMIADLLRNDLGRVCRLGSVRAARPALLEEHATVLQLVSVIEGRLEPGRTRADLLASAFPPGSMTGAPKVRSIELLRALERWPRGPYGGALGYLAADGRTDLSVVIRSALLAGGAARVNVGGGIVWDSTPEGEFEESRIKAAPLLRALAAAQAASARSAP